MRKLVILAAVFMAFTMAQTAYADPPSNYRGPTLTLRPGETSKSMPIQFTVAGPDGKSRVVRGTLEVSGTLAPSGKGQPSGDVRTATVYGRTCTGRLSVVPYGFASLSVTDTWYYDFNSIVYQGLPSAGSSSAFPYSWSNVYAYNTPWGSQYAFSDGVGTLNVYQVLASYTYHVYIQIDAWGNCTAGWWQA
jgi:hypothetical protein